MFDTLSDRLEAAFSGLRRKGRLTRADIEEGLTEIRSALLEADVEIGVTNKFLERIRTEATGEKVLGSLTPGQQIVKIVHDELVGLLGTEQRKLLRAAPGEPTVILLVGLQGSGKTTAAAKLARLLKTTGTRPLLAACDLQRPAAVDQLTTLANSIGVAIETGDPGGDPVAVAVRALERAKRERFSALIVDSAGRTTVDEQMMVQAVALKEKTNATETLLVLDSMTGQDAVRTAQAFTDRLKPTGSILTKLDGDSRGGAALSLRDATGVPILYASVGEKVEDLETFHPDRMAQRILGMGDVLSLIEKAEAAIGEDQAADMERKVREARFDLGDFLDQLQMIKKMGPVQGLLKMMPSIPGVGRINDSDIDESKLTRVEAVIRSMTPLERKKPDVIDGSRRRRIAVGSGTSPKDVNEVLQQFDQMRKMMRKMAPVQKLAEMSGARSSRKARKTLGKMKGF